MTCFDERETQIPLPKHFALTKHLHWSLDTVCEANIRYGDR